MGRPTQLVLLIKNLYSLTPSSTYYTFIHIPLHHPHVELFRMVSYGKKTHFTIEMYRKSGK